MEGDGRSAAQRDHVTLNPTNSMYEITITRIESKVEMQRSDSYAVVDKIPWTDEDLKDRSTHYGNPAEFLKENPLHEVLGYPPAREVTVNTKTEVLKQTVDELNLAAVIKAINNL